MTPTVELPDDLALVSEYLHEASQYGLTAEVVMTAMRAIQQRPELPIANAIHLAFHDCVK